MQYYFIPTSLLPSWFSDYFVKNHSLLAHFPVFLLHNNKIYECPPVIISKSKATYALYICMCIFIFYVETWRWQKAWQSHRTSWTYIQCCYKECSEGIQTIFSVNLIIIFKLIIRYGFCFIFIYDFNSDFSCCTKLRLIHFKTIFNHSTIPNSLFSLFFIKFSIYAR